MEIQINGISYNIIEATFSTDLNKSHNVLILKTKEHYDSWLELQDSEIDIVIKNNHFIFKPILLFHNQKDSYYFVWED